MKKRRFGQVDGREVSEITLESADAAVSILDWGCVLRDWRVDGPRGSLPMVLGFPSLDDYVLHSRSHGAIVGRVANRIKDGRFDLEGKTYELTKNHGPGNRHHIHGNLGTTLWEMEGDSGTGTIHLRHVSPDGDDGYPGKVEFEVTYKLVGPRLVCEMRGHPDRPTPINLAHHAYFNLSGAGDVRDHTLWIDAAEYTPLDGENIPLGTIAPVAGTHLDFRAPREIAESDPDRLGIDNNFVLRAGRREDEAAAWASSPRTGRRIELRTTEPGLQVFNAAKMTIEAPGHDHAAYGPFAGLCLEAQHFPDSVHHPDWPSVIRTPEHPYFQRWTVDITQG